MTCIELLCADLVKLFTCRGLVVGTSIASQPYVSFQSLILKISGHVIRNIRAHYILLKSPLEVSY